LSTKHIRTDASLLTTRTGFLPYGLVIAPALITGLLSYLSESYVIFSILGIIWALIFPTFISLAYLRLSREEPYTFHTFFVDEAHSNGRRYVLAAFFKEVYLLGWTLLFIIPGIVMQIAYVLSPYLLKDNPDLTANESIALSSKLMNGHKWRYVGLYLSIMALPMVLIALTPLFFTAFFASALVAYSPPFWAILFFIFFILTAFSGFVLALRAAPRLHFATALFYEQMDK